MARFALVSFRHKSLVTAKTPAANRSREWVHEATDLACAELASHVVFPGWTFCYSLAQIERGEPHDDIKWLADLSRARKLGVLAELRQTRLGDSKHGFVSPLDALGFIAFDRGDVAPRPVAQRFATAGDVAIPNGSYAETIGEIVSGRRDLMLGGVRCLVLVCGENNLLRNIQREGNRVVLRHDLGGLSVESLRRRTHQVVLNPAHTEFGNLGKIHNRWLALSEGSRGAPSRYCFSTTNVMGDAPGGAAFFAARNGVRLQLDGWRDPNQGGSDPERANEDAAGLG